MRRQYREIISEVAIMTTKKTAIFLAIISLSGCQATDKISFMGKDINTPIDATKKLLIDGKGYYERPKESDEGNFLKITGTAHNEINYFKQEMELFCNKTNGVPISRNDGAASSTICYDNNHVLFINKLKEIKQKYGSITAYQTLQPKNQFPDALDGMVPTLKAMRDTQEKQRRSEEEMQRIIKENDDARARKEYASAKRGDQVCAIWQAYPEMYVGYIEDKDNMKYKIIISGSSSGQLRRFRQNDVLWGTAREWKLCTFK